MTDVKLDLRIRLDEKDSEMLQEIKEFYNLANWTEVIRLCIAEAYRSIKTKNN